MFDPTIFENLKVVVEGKVYDLDFDGLIYVNDRSEIVNLSTMSRTYMISFREKDKGDHTAHAQLTLKAHLEDLAGEILQQSGVSPGCELSVGLKTTVSEGGDECSLIEKSLLEIWGNRPTIRQKLSYQWGSSDKRWENQITLDFGRKINEDHVSDLTSIIEHMLKSIAYLNDFKK